MSLKLSKEALIAVLETKSPKSLTEAYRLLGGQGKLSGSTAKRMRSLVAGIDDWVDNNKAMASGERGSRGKKTNEESPTFRISKTSKGARKTPKVNKSKAPPRHPKNPFRPGGYATLIDLIAEAGSKGIGKEDLLEAYCKITGKDLQHARYDLAVINSAEAGRNRHRSMKDGVTIILDGANYQVRFD